MGLHPALHPAPPPHAASPSAPGSRSQSNSEGVNYSEQPSETTHLGCAQNQKIDPESEGFLRLILRTN